jgi:hypothetical protein
MNYRLLLLNLIFVKGGYLDMKKKKEAIKNIKVEK